MKKFIRDLVEYTGIEPYVDERCPIDSSNSFKQSNIDLEFCVPCQKPDMEQVVKIDVTNKVYKSVLVKTPRGKSAEGQVMTGYKLLVMGDITIKVRYVADEPTQSMHTFHADIPFCEYVVLPLDFCPLGAVKPEIYIEDIYVAQQDARCLFGNITMMLVIEQC